VTMLSGASAGDLLRRLTTGEVSAAEVVAAHQARIDGVDRRVGALLRIQRDEALAQAVEIDRRRRAGGPLGRLAGLPVAV
jgi:Asp-tRNA(Asn)/Glu-tRNA(Gln) amidotransferase A subunit family amidase